MPVAFTSGPVIKNNAEVWGTRLAIDTKYSFYSPGLILVNELIKYMIDKTAYRVLNLGQGTEKYKYDMGGFEVQTTDWLLKLDKKIFEKEETHDQFYSRSGSVC